MPIDLLHKTLFGFPLLYFLFFLFVLICFYVALYYFHAQNIFALQNEMELVILHTKFFCSIMIFFFKTWLFSFAGC